MAVVAATDEAMASDPFRPVAETREFVETLPGDTEPYGVRLRERIEAFRTGLLAASLAGWRPEDRVPGRLLGWDRVNEIVNAARESNNAAFAPYSRLETPYVGGTGSPDDTIVDIWEYYEPMMQTAEGIDELATEALHQVIHGLDIHSEHGARLDLFALANRESQIAYEVMEEQLNDPARARQWAEYMRNWSGMTLSGKAIVVRRWLLRAPRRGSTWS